MKFKSAITFMVMSAIGATSWAQIVENIPHGVKATVDSVVVELEYYTPSSVRVLKYPLSESGKPAKESFSIIAKPENVAFKMQKSSDKVTLKSDKVSVSLNLKNGDVSFSDAKGRKLIQETATSFIPVMDGDVPAYRVEETFRLDKDEPIYGLGNYENGKLSMRGFSRTLQPGNVEDGIPVMQSVKGYGIIWDNYSPTDFRDNEKGMTFSSSAGDCIDYYFMYGGNADGVIAQIRTLTGEVPMFPLWTYGFWQSRERYKSQNEIMEVVAKHRELGVPIDGIIQDWQYWGNNYLWNAMEFMNPEFNNPKMMMDSLHNMNSHVIISIWSSFGPQTKPYRELNEKDLLFDFSTWPESGIAEQWPPRMDYPSGVRAYNPYSAEARDIYWNNLRRLYDFDMDGWWMDSTEPDFFNGTEADMNHPTGKGTFRRVRGAYPLATVGGVYDHQRATSNDKRVFILTRSGWTGQQRYGCNVWSGDVNSTWEMLRNTVPALLNFSMTGNPNTNSDIGGFFCSGYNTRYGDNSAPKNPLFQELYVRWLQMGAFNPMMRSHGTDIFREIYYFGKKGETVYDAIEETIRLRYSFLPYIYSTSWQVTDNNYTYLRPLMMDFQNDKKGWERNDQFLFGPSLLVAPVLEAQYTPEKVMKADENTGWNKKENTGTTTQATGKVDFMAPSSTEVYLPAGTEWYDFWTNEKLRGGQSIQKETTLKTIPLYVRAGGIIPLGPDVQYASEKPWDNLEIRVYPGKNGEFVLYEDEGDNYNYEKGQYSTITFDWNDKKNELTISDRKGSFPGMLSSRKFRLRNMANPSSAPVVIDYAGQGKTVKL